MFGRFRWGGYSSYRLVSRSHHRTDHMRSCRRSAPLITIARPRSAIVDRPRIKSLIADGAVTVIDDRLPSATARNSWFGASRRRSMPTLRIPQPCIVARSEPRQRFTLRRGMAPELPPNICYGSAGFLCRESWMPPASQLLRPAAGDPLV